MVFMHRSIARARGANHPPVAIKSYVTCRVAGGSTKRFVDSDGLPRTIIGVTPPGFYGIVVGEHADVMVPVMMKAQMTPTRDDLLNRRSRWLAIMARLKPGVPAGQAESAMNVVYRQINEQEIKEIQPPSQSFRKRFVEKHLSCIRDRQADPICATSFRRRFSC
jgi:hypothetical protein